MNNWTIKELETISNRNLILRIISERINKLTNPYSPLSQRLFKLAIWIEKNIPDTEVKA